MLEQEVTLRFHGYTRPPLHFVLRQEATQIFGVDRNPADVALNVAAAAKNCGMLRSSVEVSLLSESKQLSSWLPLSVLRQEEDI